MAVVDELVTVLGVELSSTVALNLGRFAKMLGAGMVEAAKLGVAIVGARTALEAYLQVAVSGATEMQKLSERTGLATEELQKWGYAAERAGGSAESLYGDLERLQQQYLGSGKSAERQLLALADQFQGMSGSSAQVHGRFWGLSDDTIQLLRKGRQGVKELRQEAEALGGVVPEELIKRGFEFRKTLNEIRFALKGIGQQVILGTLPVLEKIIAQFKEWIKVNRDWIKENIGAVFKGLIKGFDRFLDGIVKVYNKIAPLTDKLKGFTSEMTKVDVIMRVVTAALAAMTLALIPFAAKWLAISAALSAAILVIEDIWTYFEGGDSILGRLIAKLSKFIDKIKELGKEIKNSELFQVLSGLASGLQQLTQYVMSLMKLLLPKGDEEVNTDSQGGNLFMAGGSPWGGSSTGESTQGEGLGAVGSLLNAQGGEGARATIPSTTNNNSSVVNKTTNNYNYPSIMVTPEQRRAASAYATSFYGLSPVPVSR